MNPILRAVIDVGTNSVKLLVADVTAGEVRPVTESSEQTRLGAGFFETHILQPEAVGLTAKAVARFAEQARELKAVSVRVIATSAARDAKNPGDLTGAIQKASGLTVEIISGEQEADWAFQGVTTDPRYATEPLVLMDVGGGSTEFVLGRGQEKQFQKSFQLGTVRLLEKLPPSDPPTAAQLADMRQYIHEFLTREVKPELGPILLERFRKYEPSFSPLLIGTGGSATILARMHLGLETYDRDLIENARLSLADVRAQTERLWSLPLSERRNTTGLPKNRADVILTGIAIYDRVMHAFGFEELRISMRGLRFAAVMKPVRS